MCADSGVLCIFMEIMWKTPTLWGEEVSSHEIKVNDKKSATFEEHGSRVEDGMQHNALASCIQE